MPCRTGYGLDAERPAVHGPAGKAISSRRRRRSAAGWQASCPTVPLTLFAIHFNFGGSDADRAPRSRDRRRRSARPPSGWRAWIRPDLERRQVCGTSRPGCPRPSFAAPSSRSRCASAGRSTSQHGGTQTLTDHDWRDGHAGGRSREQTVTLDLRIRAAARSRSRFRNRRASCRPMSARSTLALEWYAIERQRPRTRRSARATHPLYFTWQADHPRPRIGRPSGLGLCPARPVDVDVCRRRDLRQRRVRSGDGSDCRRPASKYGVAGWTPRQMLLGNGGMCGGWYQLFQCDAAQPGHH